MFTAGEPVDVESALANPKTYEDTILRIFAKRSDRGAGFAEAFGGVSYFSTAAGRQTLAKAIAARVTSGEFETRPVDLWILETGGKRREAHLADFIDHIVGSTLFKLLTHNAQCHGLPGVYSYLSGVTNVVAMQTFAAYIRAHRDGTGSHRRPLYVLQSDFEKYGDHLPVGPDAALWKILRTVATLGSGDGEISSTTWDLITGLVRPVVREDDGTEFIRLRGVAMGTPLVPLLGNLAVAPMDQAITAIDGIFYARYNDDFIIAHPDLDTVHEADARIDSLMGELGVKRKLSKELRTALSGNGMPSTDDPAYLGRDRIDCLGLTVSHAGTISLGPHRLSRFIARIARRLDAIGPALSDEPVDERARHLVAATNVMLDVTSPFAVAGLSSILDTTTDRGSLKDLDFRIARKIVQVATKRGGVRGFRHLPPAALYREMGLSSLVVLRNMR
ncbi:hypothetical protein DVS77_30305 [Mycolicibacterium moriokaense]|nr:hypothetical protein DVS77_30305 [Mycolicibacterium moriokaense]